MELATIIKFVNKKLAGEQLQYEELLVHLDSVVDEINSRLNAKFPVFSEFNNSSYAQYPNYNFFPDKYIRLVVIPGAAYKFYTTDEEGIISAPAYQEEYEKNLFYMERDYSGKVPLIYQDDSTGALVLTETEMEEDSTTISEPFFVW